MMWRQSCTIIPVNQQTRLRQQSHCRISILTRFVPPLLLPSESITASNLGNASANATIFWISWFFSVTPFNNSSNSNSWEIWGNRNRQQIDSSIPVYNLLVLTHRWHTISQVRCSSCTIHKCAQRMRVLNECGARFDRFELHTPREQLGWLVLHANHVQIENGE